MSFLIEATLKGTLLLLAVTAGALTLRRSSAATRHFVWGLGLLGLLVLPLVSWTLPWRLAVLPGRPAAPAVVRHASAAAATAAPLAVPSTDVEIEPWGTQPATTVSTPRPDTPPHRSLPVPAILVALWGAGLVAALAWLGLGHLTVAGIVRRADPLTEPEWHAELEAAARRLGLRQPVALRVSHTLRLPMTAGAFHPCIILPIASAGWTDARRRAVLLHELAHVRRRDLLAQLIARLACAAYWFHPLVWIAARRLRLEAERACDDLVLLVGTRPSDYAGLLLQLVRLAGFVRAPAVALPMAQPSDFEGRLLAILQPGVLRRPTSRRTAALAAVSVATLLVPIAALGGAPAHVISSSLPPSQTAVADTGLRSAARAATRPAIARQSRAAGVGVSRATSSALTASQSMAVSASIQGTVTDQRPVLAGSAATRRAVATLRAALADQHGERHAASPEAVRGLTTALADVAPEVRRSAAEALGNLQDTAAVAALVEALRKDSDADVRQAAAWALGQLESHRAVQALVAALREDRDVRVRRKAAWALGQIQDASAVDGLAAAMRDGDLEVRSQSVWALGQIESPAAVPALVTALQDSASGVRKQAAWALGQVHSADAVDPLMRSLGDRDRDVREQTAWALGQIENARAVPGLTAALRDSVAGVRAQVAWALGQIQSADAVDGLVGALSDRSVKVREQVAWALGQIQSPRAAPALAAALKDSSRDVRRQAIWAIGQLDGVHQAPPALIEALKDPDADVRRSAAQALAQMEDPAAVPGLIQLVKDPDVDVRRSAIQALGQFDDPRIQDALVEALKDSSAAIRRAAAQALGRQ